MVGGRQSRAAEGEESALTDIQYTQLMPQTGKSNNVICTGGSHIYYPICPPGGGWKYYNNRQHHDAHVKNFRIDIVGRLLGTSHTQIEK